MSYNLYNGDCLELMQNIPDKSIDMILCDLPYGITRRNKWDKVIDITSMWEQYNRIIKDNGAICLFSMLPFSCDLINANRKYFRYEWVWEKNMAVGFLNAKRMPLRSHENILVFYKHLPTYNPQKTDGKPYKARHKGNSLNYDKQIQTLKTDNVDGKRYPRDVIKFSNANLYNHLHPTQKPVDVCEYFIKTYTNENETVLDNCMGSGTTGVACRYNNRNFIGMELNKDFFNVAKERIENCTRGGKQR